jgi:hypothetical protein
MKFVKFLFFDSLMHCGTTMYKKTLKEELSSFVSEGAGFQKTVVKKLLHFSHADSFM